MPDDLAIICCQRLPNHTILVPLDVLYCSGQTRSDLNVLASPDGNVHCSADIYETVANFSTQSMTQ